MAENENEENSIAQLKADLMRQEHRLFHLVKNYWYRDQFAKDDPQYDAVVNAFLWRICLALLPTAAVAGVGVVGILSLLLARDANTLVGEQNRLLQNQEKLLQSQTNDMTNQLLLAEGQRRSEIIGELSSILDELGRQSVNQRTRIADADTEKIVPSNFLIGRIVALTKVAKPYRFLEVHANNWMGRRFDFQTTPSDEPTRFALSPERGQILVSLLQTKTDIQPILNAGADFTYADLRGIRFPKGGSLIGIDLSFSDVTGSSLIDVDLSYSLLRGTRFDAADLTGAFLDRAIAHNASFVNSDLRGASFIACSVLGARFSGAILVKTIFVEFGNETSREIPTPPERIGQGLPTLMAPNGTDFFESRFDGAIVDFGENNRSGHKPTGKGKRWAQTLGSNSVLPEIATKEQFLGEKTSLTVEIETKNHPMIRDGIKVWVIHDGRVQPTKNVD